MGMEFDKVVNGMSGEEINHNDPKTSFLVGKNIIKEYRNGVLAVNNVSFAIGKGKCLGLVGESGCGKSTLARCILMLEKISGGEIWMNGVGLHKLDNTQLRKFRKKMQIVFQNPTSSLNSKRKIIDSLLEPLDCQKDVVPDFIRDIRYNRRKVGKWLLDKMELPEKYLDMYPHELSGGQKQRVTIARSLSINPSLIILDEPTSSLDVSVQAKVLNLLKDLQEQFELTYLFISHDLSAVNFMSDKIMVMYRGSIVDRFDKDSIFSSERHSYTKTLLDIFES